jgi:hypothetical protein
VKALAEFLRVQVDASGKTLAVLASEIQICRTQISERLGGKVPDVSFVVALLDATIREPRLREHRLKAARCLRGSCGGVDRCRKRFTCWHRSWSEEHSFHQECEAGSAEHLAFEHLDAVYVPFHDARVVGQRERGGDRGAVAIDAGGEGVETG